MATGIMDTLISILVCLGAFVVLVWLVRRDGMSFGLPIAYLFSLLLIHVPGAYAHLIGGDSLFDSDLVAVGIWFTAVGAVCFVTGVWLDTRFSRERTQERQKADDLQHFELFCLIGGWIFTYGLSFLLVIPSFGAVVEKAGAVWLLGVLLGLQSALSRRDFKWAALWFSALALYPVMGLLMGGFLSYGSKAVIIVISVYFISIRGVGRLIGGTLVVVYVGLSIFVNYYQHRDDIRNAVWGGAGFEERIDVSLDIVRDFEWLDLAKEAHLNAFDQRLNQNYFAGLAAVRIDEGQVDYLRGRSLWEGAMSLVPRYVWADKPVFGGSGQIVSEMTGLVLNEDTSFGVGNVMEFQINFGVPGVVLGFLLLGWLMRRLDRKAALAISNGDPGRALLFFLPAVALIQPNGSMVEITGGPVAALIAAYGWKWAWAHISPLIAHARKSRIDARGAS